MNMDVESVTAELYAVRPSEFTSARDAYVAKARKAGDRELAAAIAALRKPTVAVWTAGLLARGRPEEARQLLLLGEALRTAHRTLDAGQLRKLSHDQHLVIGRLARTARSLAAEFDQTVSEPVLSEVERILHAVLADPEVAERWAGGRLVRSPDPASGFTGLEPQPGAAPPRRKESAPPEPAGPATRRTPAPGTDGGAEQTRRQRIEAAREELSEARAEADRLSTEEAAAQELADGAEAAVRSAVARLEEARAASAAAAAGLRTAGQAAAKARKRADVAARKAEKLTGSEA
ncbi:hypothetical protein ACIA8F_15550 [Streptomyces sp. NPDC051563]|uniref:hypothetical protein n=1 Tax=Streptomyces sp. NPDC051563 TaxID=3365659 RepID=UPI0037BB752A